MTSVLKPVVHYVVVAVTKRSLLKESSSYYHGSIFCNCVHYCPLAHTKQRPKNFEAPGCIFTEGFPSKKGLSQPYSPFREIAFGRVQAALKRGGKANKCAAREDIEEDFFLYQNLGTLQDT